MTLHQVITLTKKILMVVGLLTLAGALILIIATVGNAVKERFFPTPRPPPLFGKLQPISFPKSTITKPQSFTTDTLSGTLPVLVPQLPVYAIEGSQPSLLSLQRAKGMVAKIGFFNDPVTFSDTLYLWNDEAPPFRKLIFDVVSMRFLLLSNFFVTPEVIRSTNLPQESEAVEIAKSFLSTITFPEDIDPAKTKTTLFTMRNSELIKVENLANANIIEVDFFQRDSNSLPIYYANHPHSLMQVFIAGGRQPNVVQANFSYQRVGIDHASYPIITAEEALKRLEEGKGYIVSYKGSGTVVIRNVSLGYYLGEKRQGHLMPIVVFEGDDDFIAFVSAVRDEWIRK